MKYLVGCSIEKINNETCRDYIAKVTLQSEDQTSDDDLKWLLAFCDDGVVWGYHDATHKTWKDSSGAFPDISPTLTYSSLQELRLFGEAKEVLIWRQNGSFQGRILSDIEGEQFNNDDPWRPSDEVRLLLGDRILAGPKDGFTLVGDATGSQQVVPLPCSENSFRGGKWPLRLSVRHYFERDEEEESGAVKVAVSRLVNVFMEEE